MSTKLALVSSLALAALAGTAQAGITDPVLDITATSSLGTASYHIGLDGGAWHGDTWTMLTGQEIQLTDPATGQVIGTVRDLFVEFVEDPQVTVNFTAVSGPVPTSFTFSSGALSFSNIDSSLAFATAGVTVTDNDSNGATFTGLLGGDGYKAIYNGATTYDTLMGTYSVPTDDSLTQNERSPGTGTTGIGTTFSMQADWNFMLSANDQVGGTSLFKIIPAPGSAALLGLAAVAFIRRRR